jgi:hypothetical protein
VETLPLWKPWDNQLQRLRDRLAQAMLGMAAALTAIERRIRVVQQKTSDHGF